MKLAIRGILSSSSYFRLIIIVSDAQLGSLFNFILSYKNSSMNSIVIWPCSFVWMKSCSEKLSFGPSNWGTLSYEFGISSYIHLRLFILGMLLFRQSNAEDIQWILNLKSAYYQFLRTLRNKISDIDHGWCLIDTVSLVNTSTESVSRFLILDLLRLTHCHRKLVILSRDLNITYKVQ